MPQLRAGDPSKVDQRLFCHVVDHFDYLWTLATLRILDAVAGPEPEAPADQPRGRDRERIERAFPKIELL